MDFRLRQRVAKSATTIAAAASSLKHAPERQGASMMVSLQNTCTCESLAALHSKLTQGARQDGAVHRPVPPI
jgi:hypothetical protein